MDEEDSAPAVTTEPPAGVGESPEERTARIINHTLTVYATRKEMAKRFTSLPLYPPSVADFVHPFGRCSGHRDMHKFNFTEAFEADSLRRTGRPARGFPYLHQMRRYYQDARRADEERAAHASGVHRGLQTQPPRTPEPYLDTSDNRTRAAAVDRRLPANATESGFLILDYNETYVVNETRIWEHLIPDAREAFASEHEACVYSMTRMIAVFAAVMEKHNLRSWFISHGTLLGAVRHGGFIPWDVDVDIVMPKSHLKLLRKVWRREFPRDMFLQSEKTEPAFHMWIGSERGLRLKDRYSSFIDVSFNLKRKGRTIRVKPYHVGAHIDFVPLERIKRSTGLKIFHNYFGRSDIFPLSAVCFENMVLPAPRNATAFLIALYGPDFMRIPEDAAMFPQPGSNPCLATPPRSVQRSGWALSWRRDGRGQGPGTVPLQKDARPDVMGPEPVLWPRGDPGGSFKDDFANPYGA